MSDLHLTCSIPTRQNCVFHCSQCFCHKLIRGIGIAAHQIAVWDEVPQSVMLSCTARRVLVQYIPLCPSLCVCASVSLCAFLSSSQGFMDALKRVGHPSDTSGKFIALKVGQGIAPME